MTQQSHCWTYLEKTIIQKDTCTPMFIVALFTIARTWKQRIGLMADEWIKKMWNLYTMGYCPVIKMNETGSSVEIYLLHKFLSAQYSIVNCNQNVIPIKQLLFLPLSVNDTTPCPSPDHSRRLRVILDSFLTVTTYDSKPNHSASPVVSPSKVCSDPVHSSPSPHCLSPG